MFDYYFATIFFAILLMVIMKIMIVHNDLLEKTTKKKLDIIATIIIITSFSEWSGVQLDGGAAWTRGIHIMVKVLELSLAPWIPLICADIIGKLRYRKVLFGILGFQAALELLSGWMGFIFKVDSQNIYSHEQFYWIYVVSFLMGILLFIIVSLDQSMKQYGLRKILLFMLPVFALCGLFFQYFGEEVRVIWLCTAIDVMLMYNLYMELTQNTDVLTHLLNRRYYESRISRIRNSVTIFYFDVNNFKHINDTYGHAVGDVCLATVGACIQEAFGKKGTCYRIGGDEFCAILPVAPEEADAYIKMFTMEMRDHRAKMKELPFVSVGYAYHEPGKNSIVDTIKKADEMMYYYKKLSKELGEEKICEGITKESVSYKLR